MSIGVKLAKEGTPFFNISEEHIQLMHKGAKHYHISFSFNDCVQICVILYSNLTPGYQKSKV